jgi:hypothetical protein
MAPVFWVQEWPSPWHLGQVTNPLFVLQTMHLPVTTQNTLRVSPVPWQSWQTTSPLPPHRGQVAVSPVGFDDSIYAPLMALKTLQIVGYSNGIDLGTKKPTAFSVGFTIDSPPPK